ncbi:MAG: sugar ABC transporter permease [Clostridiales bacterium]|nr:sugar ABC transporter permease [Clostridiales bacterium]
MKPATAPAITANRPRPALPKPVKYRYGKAEREEARAAKLFLIPAFVGLAFLTYMPLAAVFGISLFQWKIPGSPSFIGFDNYKFLLTEDFFFWTSIRVTLVYAGLSVGLSMVYAMIVALLLNSKIPGRAMFRTIFYLPFVIPAVSTFLSWSLIYDGGGIINNFVAMAGGDRIHFLSNTQTIIPALSIIAVWTSGNLIVIKMAGLGNVPRIYLEAAEIDGANTWQRFWRITMPCMTPIIFYNVLMSLVANMQIFVPSLLMAKGGGSGTGTIPESYLFMTFTMYRSGFMNGQFGIASAISFIFFILVGIFTAILFVTSKSWLFYEGGDPR